MKIHLCISSLTISVIFAFHLIRINHTLVLYENDLNAYLNKVTFEEALRICKSEGMNLVRIDNEESNQLVSDFAINHGLRTYWIDGSYKDSEGKWVYSDGIEITFSKWYENEPINLGNAKCIHGNFFNNSYWKDISCNSNNIAICHGDPTERFSSNQLVIIPGKKTYHQAISECKSRGYNLVKIQSEDINQMVFHFAARNTLGRYWINGNDMALEDHWVYNDGRSLVYSKWHKNEPNNLGIENCIHGAFYGNGFWNDIKCNHTNAVICYATKIFDNEMNAFPNQVNYDRALQICKSEGINIVRISNEESNEIVFNFAINNGLGKYWIDGNDKNEEGKWVYSDGRDLTYSKWYLNEPNNKGNEDCIHGAFFQNSFWNDISCYSKNTVICVGNPTISYTENNLIHLPGQMKHQDAVNICKNNGYNLVKIQNEDVNQMVFNYAVKKRIGKYWIDGNDMDDEGKWIYNDGADMVYNKWFSREPNNYANEDCIHGLYYPNGFWNDISCKANNSVICYGGTIRI